MGCADSKEKTAAPTIKAGEQLNKGQSIVSANGRFKFIVQEDGNAVIYRGERALWATHTDKKTVTHITLLADGALILKNAEETVWATETKDSGADKLTIQDDGNLVLLDKDGQVKWESDSTFDDGQYDLRTQFAVVLRQPVGVHVEAGKTYYWCTCGKSKNQPFCDGSHQGTDFKPLAWTAPEAKEVYFCVCKMTDNAPFCDGAHGATPFTAVLGTPPSDMTACAALGNSIINDKLIAGLATLQVTASSTLRLAIASQAASEPVMVVAKTPQDPTRAPCLEPPPASALATVPSVAELEGDSRSDASGDAAAPPARYIVRAAAGDATTPSNSDAGSGSSGRRTNDSSVSVRSEVANEVAALLRLAKRDAVAHALAYHEESGTLFTEFSEGDDLDKTFFKKKLGLGTVVRLFRSVLSVLADVNSPVHSDVIPRNITLAVNDDCRVVAKVIDWNDATSVASSLKGSSTTDPKVANRGLGRLHTTELIQGFERLLRNRGDGPKLWDSFSKLLGNEEAQSFTFADLLTELDKLSVANPETDADKLDEASAINAFDAAIWHGLAWGGEPLPEVDTAAYLILWCSAANDCRIPRIRQGRLRFYERDPPHGSLREVAARIFGGARFPHVDFSIAKDALQLLKASDPGRFPDNCPPPPREAHAPQGSTERSAPTLHRLTMVGREWCRTTPAAIDAATGRLKSDGLLRLLHAQRAPQMRALTRWLTKSRDVTLVQLMLTHVRETDVHNAIALLAVDAAVSRAESPSSALAECLATWLNAPTIVRAVAAMLSKGAPAPHPGGRAAAPWTVDRHSELVRLFVSRLVLVHVPQASYLGITLRCGVPVVNVALHEGAAGCTVPMAVLECRLAMTAVHEFGHFARQHVLGPDAKTPEVALPQKAGAAMVVREAGELLERALSQGSPAAWPTSVAAATAMLRWTGIAPFPLPVVLNAEADAGVRRSAVMFLLPRDTGVAATTPRPSPALSSSDDEATASAMVSP